VTRVDSSLDRRRICASSLSASPPSLGLKHNAVGRFPKMDINRDAPAVASTEAFIRAPLDVVWSLLTNIAEWNRWTSRRLIYAVPSLPERNFVGNLVGLLSSPYSRKSSRSDESHGRDERWASVRSTFGHSRRTRRCAGPDRGIF